MKMVPVCRKFVSVLSAAVMSCSALSFRPPLSSAAEQAVPSEAAVPFDRVDGLRAGSYSPDRVNILLKQTYSRDYDGLLEKVFSDPMFRGYEVLSDPETANPDEFRLFVTADLNGRGDDAIRQALDYLETFDEIYYAGPNQYFEVEPAGAINAPRIVYDQAGGASVMPVNDPGADAMAKGISNYNGATHLTSAAAFDLIDLYEAWSITPGSPNFVLGNYETLYYKHEDLIGQMWNNPDTSLAERHGYNFRSGSGSVYSEVNDHGTFTAGIMCAAGENGVGSAGVAYGSKLMATMGSETGDAKEFQKVINFMNANEIKVYNISASWSDKLQEPVLSLIRQYKGLVVVCAHNQRRNLDEQPLYPASYSTVADNVIAVGAVDDQDNNLWNYGPQTVQIAAPCSVVGTGIYEERGKIKSNYGVAPYTSAAAPVVSGVIALIWSANPTLSAQQVKQILLDSADHVSKLDGLIQGGRRVNAYKALLAAGCSNGQYFFRSKVNGGYLNLDTSNDMLFTHNFHAGKKQQFYYGKGTLTSIYNNTYLASGAACSEGFKSVISLKKSDIAVAKNMNGNGYRIIQSVRTAKNGGECVELYALEVKESGSANSDVFWTPYNPDSEKQIWFAEDAAPVKLEEGVYTIRNAKSGQLANMEQSTGKLMQYDFTGFDNQKWQLTLIGDGQYFVKTKSALYPGQLTSSGSTPRIEKTACTFFSMYRNIDETTGEPDGTYRIHQVGTSRCLKVQNNSMSNCAPIVMDSFRNSGGDQWILTKIG